LSFRASIADELPARRRPIGLLVRLETTRKALLDDDERLDSIALDDLE
jgi:hypothetical protein